jgi:DNA-binding transcriptional LysR family regulator
MSQPASWDLFASFLAVMREGSFSAAARALGTAQPTVRRQIAALEQATGAVLFTRSPAGLHPTEAARRTLVHAEAMEAASKAFLRATTPQAAAGTVRLTCSEVFGAERLPGLLASLLAAHPGLEIELVATNRREDLLRRDADVAVRMTRPTQAALVARRVADTEVGLHASAAYLAAHPAPRAPADLAAHVLIGDDREAAIAPALHAAGAPAVRFALRSDSNLAQLAAIRAGIGIGVCQTAVAAGLRRVLPQFGARLETWVVMHEDLRQAARVRTLFDHLVQALGT